MRRRASCTGVPGGVPSLGQTAPIRAIGGLGCPTSESNRPRVRSRGVAHTPRFRTGVASTHEAFAPQPSRAAVAGIRREGRRQAQPPAADAHRLRRGAKRRGTQYLPPAKARRAGRVLRGRAPRSSIEIGTSRAQQARPLTHSLADEPKRRASAVVAWTPCAARRWRATPRRPSRRSRSRRGSMTRRRCMRTTRTREGAARPALPTAMRHDGACPNLGRRVALNEVGVMLRGRGSERRP